MAEDLPYKAEYAKTGRAGCKGCKIKIDQGALRLGVMVQVGCKNIFSFFLFHHILFEILYY